MQKEDLTTGEIADNLLAAKPVEHKEPKVGYASEFKKSKHHLAGVQTMFKNGIVKSTSG